MVCRVIPDTLKGVMLSRRHFIRTGIVGTAGLATVRVLYGPFFNPAPVPFLSSELFHFLTPHDLHVFHALIPVFLEGTLSQSSPEIYQKILLQIDSIISGMPLVLQKEVRDLMNLLAFPITRRLLAQIWKPWTEASASSVSAFLFLWKESRFSLLQSAYRALSDLVYSAWYSLPQSWDAIGYSGPPLRLE